MFWEIKPGHSFKYSDRENGVAMFLKHVSPFYYSEFIKGKKIILNCSM